VAAACLFMTGKSEECPRKLEHIVEAWFKLKHRNAEVQPPFNDIVSFWVGFGEIKITNKIVVEEAWH
jgi:hypothetical protein